jgi:hypothetical protein
VAEGLQVKQGASGHISVICPFLRSVDEVDVGHREDAARMLAERLHVAPDDLPIGQGEEGFGGSG